jgi:hypothetical protein
MVARLVAARYTVAAFAFMAAATWLGVGLTSGFACLFVFVIACQAVRLYQRQSGSRARAGSRRKGRAYREAASAEEREISPPPAPTRSRHRSGRVYDGGREELGWPVASEATR